MSKDRKRLVAVIRWPQTNEYYRPQAASGGTRKRTFNFAMSGSQEQAARNGEQTNECSAACPYESA